MANKEFEQNNDQIYSTASAPDEPLRPIDPGDDPPDPPSVAISQISPRAGGLAGGISVKLTGTGFQPGAEVYFGSSLATQVTYESSSVVHATLPASGTTGSVSVSLVNPDGNSDTIPGGFTYVTTASGEQAEVIGVTPLAVIENTDTEVTLRGRNLIAAYSEGLVALRGPSRAQINITNVSSSRDEDTGIESLDLTLRVTANPPLQPLERIAVQILASRRAGSANDGVVESSRQMFTVLPGSAPVPLAYTANLDPGKPNLVMVAGRNLEGCTLEIGDGATVHLQKSDDQFLSGVVTVKDNVTNSFASSGPLQLSLLDSGGNMVGQYEMAVASGTGSAGLAESPNEEFGVNFTAIPDQQFSGPTENDSAVFNLNGQTASSIFFDWSNFEYTILDITIVLPIINEVYLIPFFDGGGELNSPVLAQVGKLFRLRGAGLLVALRFEVVIHIRVVLIIGFIYNIWPYGLYNEFPEYGWSIGSIVIGIRIEIDVYVIISFLVALVKPGGELRILVAVNLTAGIDFTIDNNGHLRFDPRFTHRVRIAGITPVNNLQPCGGRFQLAEENGQTVFLDSVGGYQSFYLPRSAGECCLPWDFNMELVRFTSNGSEETVQQRFQANYCLTTEPSPNQFIVMVTSEPPPEGIPPTLVMDIADSATLKALAVPVDSNGNPTGEPPQDLRDLDYGVEFFTESPPDVLDPTTLPDGNAFAIQEGNNLIRAAVTSVRALDEEPVVAFRPESILGFDIIRALAEGESPRLRTGGLPVRVNQITDIRIEPTLAYYDDQGKLQPVTEMERYEPHEAQRAYLLAAKVARPSNLTTDVTITFPSINFLMKGRRNGSFANEAPLRMPTDPQFPGNRGSNSNVTSFFNGDLVSQSALSLKISQSADLSKLIAFENATIKPNQFEDGVNLVPPGSKVTDKEVILNVKLANNPTSNSGHNVVVSQIEFNFPVQNDETYEEYYRVFKEIRELMQLHSGRSSTSLALGNFAEKFHAKLTQVGLSQTELKSQGQSLWQLGYQFVQNTKKDDRILYYARLESIAVLRAFCKRQKPSLTLSPENLNVFEWSSRGLETMNGTDAYIKFDPTTDRKVVVTGFDPFFLHFDPKQNNPSGLVALDFHNKNFGSSAIVKTAVFPVRFREFDQSLIEKVMREGVKTASTIMTSSQGRSGSLTNIGYYDVDRFATRYRTTRPSSIDNEHQVSSTNLPSGINAPHYLESTLPYVEVFTAKGQQRLAGPEGQTMFVMNQAYVVDRTRDQNNGGFRENPLNFTDPSSYTKVSDKPESNKEVIDGSGGDYLSNEIFYRTARVREEIRPNLGTGHLHLPPVDTTPSVFAGKAGSLLSGVKIILEQFLEYAFPLSGADEITFPNATINTGHSLAILALTNPSGSPASAVVSSVEFSSPAFQMTSQLPITIGVGAIQTLQFKFSPTEIKDYFETATLKASNGSVLYKVTLKGKGIDRQPRIVSFSPSSGPPGTWLTVVGENFTDTISVSIGGTDVSFTIDSDTTIYADVSEDVFTGYITVITSTGTATSSTTFRRTFIKGPYEPIEQ